MARLFSYQITASNSDQEKNKKDLRMWLDIA